MVLILINTSSALRADVAILVEYLNVADQDQSKFADTVKNTIRKVNLERKSNDEIFSWYHYEVRFPVGSQRQYTDVLVTVFSDFKSLENTEISAGYEAYIHHSEVFQGVPGIRSENYFSNVEYTHLTVCFMDSNPSKAQFLERMRSAVQPDLAAKIDKNLVVNWSLFSKRFPTGSREESDHAIVVRHNGFNTLEQPLLTGDIVSHLRRAEIWTLRDIVQ